MKFWKYIPVLLAILVTVPACVNTTEDKNVDENPDVAIGLGIQAIPTLILFRDGQAVDKVVGVQSKEALKAMIERNR